MKKDLLKMMKCPYCGTDFKVSEIYEVKKDKKIISGIIKCECNEFPILEGILYLKVGPLKKHILKLQKKGKMKEPLMLLLEEKNEFIWKIVDFLSDKRFYGQFFKKVLETLLIIWTKFKTTKYFRTDLLFWDILGNSLAETYFKYRFSSETLWSVYPFIPLLKKHRKRILDLGSGIGHPSFIIFTYVKPKELVCADYKFKHLYLAKKYFVKDAQFICLDANYALPFKDNIFDSVFMLDSFHYINARAQLANELKRVNSSEALILLLHLHNSLVNNIAAGNPLTPQTWINLFNSDDLKIIAIPERRIIENFLMNNELDLTEEYTENDLDSSNAISIIGTTDKSIFKVYNNVRRDFYKNKSNLMINSLYKIKCNKNMLILNKNYPNESFKEEYPLSNIYLPDTYIINGGIQKLINGRVLDLKTNALSVNDITQIERIMSRFIIVNVPEKYI